MRIDRRLGFAVALVVCGLVAVMAGACGDTITNVNVDTNQEQHAQAQPSPSPSPSGNPSAPTPGGAVASVTINGFGEVCPAGVAPSTGQRQVRVGCSLAVTVNPRTSAGQVIFDLAATGPAPDFFRQDSGQTAGSFAVSSANPFNGDIRGLVAGPLILSASVRGVLSGPVTFTVVP